MLWLHRFSRPIVALFVFLLVPAQATSARPIHDPLAPASLTVVTPLQLEPLDPIAGQLVTATFTVRNDNGAPLSFSHLGVGGRGPGCAGWTCEDYQDFQFFAVTLAPGQVYAYQAQRPFLKIGAHFSRMSAKPVGEDWFLTGDQVDFTVGPGLTAETPFMLTPNPVAAGQQVAAAIVLGNHGTRPLDLRRLGMPARGPDCAEWDCPGHVDFEPYDEPAMLAPGAQYLLSRSRSFAELGTYRVRTSFEILPGQWYDLGSEQRLTVEGGLVVAEPLRLTPGTPTTADLLTAGFALRNAGSRAITLERVTAAARGPDCSPADLSCAANVDFPVVGPVTLAPDEVWSYAESRILGEPGSYVSQIAALPSGGEWESFGPLQALAVSAATVDARSSSWQLAAHFDPMRDWPNCNRECLALAREMGITMLRMPVSWRMLEEHGKGQWGEWYIEALNEIVDTAVTLDFELYFVVLDVPCWASSDPAAVCGNDTWAYPPTDLNDYGDALTKFVALFGDRVHTWEIWNEPNMDRFWKPTPDPEAYAALLAVGHAAVKAADPTATVLGGSLAGTDTAYLGALYQAGARGHFDALALHPYSKESPASCQDARWAYLCGVDAILGVMELYGDESPLWFTEFGWSSAPPGGPDGGGVGEAAQLAFLQEALMLLERWENVPVATWYTLVDYPPESELLDKEGSMGLMDMGGRLKPVGLWLRDEWAPSEQQPAAGSSLYLPHLRIR